MTGIETKRRILLTLNLILFEQGVIDSEIFKKANEKILAMSK